MTQIHFDIIINGRVQGVGFRMGAAHKAKQLNLTGWVKNNRSGQVEIAVEGEKSQVDELVKWCEEGTMLARVDQVKISPGRLENFKKFSISK